MISPINGCWRRSVLFFAASAFSKRPFFPILRSMSNVGKMDNEGQPPTKRRRLSNEDEEKSAVNERKPITHTSLSRPVSPPPLKRAKGSQPDLLKKSPFQLTWIRDLPESSNRDAVSLRDILGDPLIAECWEFNYLHDLDFLMEAFDPDVRDLVKVHVVHGFWKNEDQPRLALKEQATKYPNLTLHTAFMPEMFGTHHSKMLILIRHDSTAQVIIHTANMIPFDWTNMTQGLWRSPLLPLLAHPSSPTNASAEPGSGSKFKTDLINYLRAYDTRRTVCKSLTEQLQKYDFSEIRASLVASVPGKQSLADEHETFWGWPGLKNALRSVPVGDVKPDIVVQISSIATLGQTDKWLRETFFKALSAGKSSAPSNPKFYVIFPTADEIRRSLNGYRSGSAIHTKIQSPAQAKQLQYLHPMLCHWAGDSSSSGAASRPITDCGRKRAAPHIKTYIRFADAGKSAIDWMLVTSANLSKQAWGEAPNAAGDVRICSYEIGVLVWPELFGEKATMVPTFKQDMPPAEAKKKGDTLVVGARMPYDLPLAPYAKDDVPWCATSSYHEPDWAGGVWNVE